MKPKRQSDLTGEERRVSGLLDNAKFQFGEKGAFAEPTIGQILSYHKNEVGVICKYVTLYDLF